MLTFVKEDVDIVDSAPPAIRLILFAILAVEKRKKSKIIIIVTVQCGLQPEISKLLRYHALLR